MRDFPAILYYIKKARIDASGQTMLYTRITINGKRAEFSTGRKVPVEHWNPEATKVDGSTYEANSVNSYISKLKNDIYFHHQQLVQEKKHISAVSLRNRVLGMDNRCHFLLEIFEEHNQRIESLVGTEYAAGTAERYRTAKKHVGDYIRKEYKVNDLEVGEVDHKFISGFEYYLKHSRKCSHNTAQKYITNFKKIIRIAFANDWIRKDPFINWKVKLKKVEREFLTETEIQTILDKHFSTERLNLVKDIFLFSCYTGLAYVDVKKLTQNDIIIGIDGGRWVRAKRQKTGVTSKIPLLPTAEFILNKYRFHEQVNNTSLLLPILSNQKMNAYLKEIADTCKIHKNLTFHLARHTFATTITLSNGVPIESVSKMLGHSNIRATQHYAKVLDNKVSNDMAVLRQRFSQ